MNYDTITGNTAVSLHPAAVSTMNWHRCWSNSTVSNNVSTWAAGIGNVGTMTIVNSIITGNTASNSGGGIFNYGGTLSVSNSLISNNQSTANGGAGVINYGPTTTVRPAIATFVNDTFTGNSAHFSGGAVDNGNSGTLSLVNDTLVANTAQEGGGLYTVSGSSTTVYNSILAGNSPPISE